MSIKDIFDAAKNADLATIEQAIAKDRSLVNAYDTNGNTLLHWATERGHAALVLTLLEAGADINVRNFGALPIHFAGYKGYPDIIDILLAAGTDLTEKDGFDRTPAEYASDHGHAQFAAYLQSITEGNTPRPMPESIGLDMKKRMDALEALGKPLGEFTHAERRRKAQRETREAQRQEALRGGGI